MPRKSRCPAVFFSRRVNPGCLRHGGFRPEIPKRWRFWDSWDLQKPKGSPSIFKEFRNSEGFMLMFIESTWITWKFTGLDFHLKSPQKVNNLNHCEWSQAFCSGKKNCWCTDAPVRLTCSCDVLMTFASGLVHSLKLIHLLKLKLLKLQLGLLQNVWTEPPIFPKWVSTIDSFCILLPSIFLNQYCQAKIVGPCLPNKKQNINKKN